LFRKSLKEYNHEKYFDFNQCRNYFVITMEGRDSLFLQPGEHQARPLAVG